MSDGQSEMIERLKRALERGETALAARDAERETLRHVRDVAAATKRELDTLLAGAEG